MVPVTEGYLFIQVSPCSNSFVKIRNYFSSWDPLDQNQVDYGYSLILEWKKILDSEENSMFSKTKSLG